jgi:hypothetical protein
VDEGKRAVKDGWPNFLKLNESIIINQSIINISLKMKLHYLICKNCNDVTPLKKIHATSYSNNNNNNNNKYISLIATTLGIPTPKTSIVTIIRKIKIWF